MLKKETFNLQVLSRQLSVLAQQKPPYAAFTVSLDYKIIRATIMYITYN